MACQGSLHSAPLSLPRGLASFFFFIAACRNWFLVVYYEAECLRAVSADTVCRLVLGDIECCRRKIIKDWRKKDRMAHAHKIAQ